MHTLRRAFLAQAGLGLGALTLGELERARAGDGATPPRASSPALARPALDLTRPHHPPRVRRVIFLYMSGGPSQFETFDYKPKLAELDGQPMPESVTQGQPIAQLQGQPLKILGPQFAFRPHGESGQQIADILPFTARHADEIAVIRSLHTDQINHDPAHTVMNTGSSISGRPSLGAWVTYGLGSEATDLPGFVVLTSEGGRNPQPISSRQWAAGFLPGRHQGLQFQQQGEAVHYVGNPPGVSRGLQGRTISTLQELDRARLERTGDPELETRIAQYELAFRMQASVPELLDLGQEPDHVWDLYGLDPQAPQQPSFARNCLLARRLAERGVRFIQLYHRGWDHHGDLKKYMHTTCGLTDQATHALLTDLRQRGLYEDTLIVWGGEFGRTPMFQGKGQEPGRDHHMRAFSMWLAGGAIRGGTSHGSSDELGYHVAEDPVHVRDLHATLLHLLGLNHRRLSYRVQGLDFRLTGVEPAHVVHQVLA